MRFEFFLSYTRLDDSWIPSYQLIMSCSRAQPYFLTQRNTFLDRSDTGNILHHQKIRAIVTTTVCSCEPPNCKFIHKLADLSEEKGQPWLPVHQRSAHPQDWLIILAQALPVIRWWSPFCTISGWTNDATILYKNETRFIRTVTVTSMHPWKIVVWWSDLPSKKVRWGHCAFHDRTMIMKIMRTLYNPHRQATLIMS